MGITIRIALVFALSLAVSARAMPPWSSPGEAVAIQGFDPVAYFTQSNSIRGTSKFVHDWNGMTWFFSSAEHRDMFIAEPEKYAPQFGGFCTMSVAYGKTSRGGGDAWTMHNGKLYLNYDKSVVAQFRQDVPGNISKAEGWWSSVKSRVEKQ
jgi:YHS domain-containing protein